MGSILKDELRRISIMLRESSGGLAVLSVVTCYLLFSSFRCNYIVCMISAFFVCLTYTNSLKEEASFYIPMSIKDRNRRIVCLGAIIAFVYFVLSMIVKVTYSTVPVLISMRKKAGVRSVFTREDILLSIYLAMVILGFALSLKAAMGFSEDTYLFGIKFPKFVRYIFIFTATFVFATVSTGYVMDINLKKQFALIVFGMVVQVIDIFIEVSQIKEADCRWFAGSEKE